MTATLATLATLGEGTMSRSNDEGKRVNADDRRRTPTVVLTSHNSNERERRMKWLGVARPQVVLCVLSARRDRRLGYGLQWSSARALSTEARNNVRFVVVRGRRQSPPRPPSRCERAAVISKTGGYRSTPPEQCREIDFNNNFLHISSTKSRIVSCSRCLNESFNRLMRHRDDQATLRIIFSPRYQCESSRRRRVYKVTTKK